MGNNKGTRGDVTRTIKCLACDRQFRGDGKMVNKLVKLHMLKEHGNTVPNDPCKSESTAYAELKITQKDQPKEFKRIQVGRDVYNEIREELSRDSYRSGF